MFAWRIQLIRDTGKLQEIVVPGVNFRSAIAIAGYDLGRVASAERCWDYNRLRVNISRRAQMIFLMKLLPYYLSGAPDQAARLFSSYAAVRRASKYYPNATDVNLSLSERLETLRFNLVVVAVIRAGERSGDIAFALKQAIANLQKEIEMHNTARKGVVGGLLLFVASLMILLGVSAGTSEALDSLIASGLVEERNFAAVILDLLGDYTRNYLWSLFLIVTFMVGAISKYQEYLKNIWPISIFSAYMKVLRSIRLVCVWLIVERAGLSIEHDEQLLATAIGEKHALRISEQRSKGETFGDLLDRRYFSETLEECCANISALDISNRILLLEQIEQLLGNEREQLASLISRTFYIIGMLITLGAIALILSGILLPIYASGLDGVQL